MLRIVKSFLTIAVVAAIAVGATGAYFSDSEIVAGNTFAAGSIDLEIGAGDEVPFTIANVEPGNSGTETITYSNTGSLDGVLDVKQANLQEFENGCIEPEVQAGDPNCSASGGDLGLVSLEIATFVDVNQNGVWDAGDIKLAYNGQVIPYSVQNYLNYSTPRKTTAGWNDIMTLSPGQAVNLVMDWRIRTDWNYPNYSQNIIMTDSLSFDVQSSLEQVGGSGGVVE